jgi:integrin alpha FG-GAP repeat containing protein 1
MIFKNADVNFNIMHRTSASPLFDKSLTDRCTWANPHSNAFVDLDGDCLADLVFVCSKSSGSKSIQIWSNRRDQGFILSLEADLPTGAGSLSFADIDGDGSIDIIFPVCQNKACSIHVVYNQQMGLCSKTQEIATTCRNAQQLCVADPNFTFDFSKPNTQNYVVFDIDTFLDDNEYILTEDSNFRGQLPVPVHTGDYNLDGYPDLLVTTNRRVLLLESTLCDTSLCSSSAQSANKRTFTVVTTGADILNKMSNPTQAAFFDIDEDVSKINQLTHMYTEFFIGFA